jgi:hypothetical protein
MCKGTLYKWTEQCQEAFDLLKQVILEGPILHHYDHELLTRVEIDTSNEVVVRVLLQQNPQTGL